jgi:hypothetical protein
MTDHQAKLQLEELERRVADAERRAQALALPLGPPLPAGPTDVPGLTARIGLIEFRLFNLENPSTPGGGGE